MGFDGQTTLADLVTARPELAPVLGRMGVDFCCGGSQTVAEAAAGAGFDVDDLLASVASVDEVPPPAAVLTASK